MEITASQVMELRKKTGAGIMECKKVLIEAEGNEEKAIELLQERGILKAAKKSGRVAAEGIVDAYVSDDKKIGALVEVNSETDFVSQNDTFKSFVKDVAKQIALNNPKDVEDLLAEKSIAEPDKTVKDVLTNKIATIGENISIRRFARFETEGKIASYIHGDGRIGVLAELNDTDDEVAKDVCMQIAAINPEFLDEKDVPEDRLNKEKEILKAQVINEGRPEAIAEKIVMGRLGKFYEEICLVDQAFIKDPSKKVKDVLKEHNATVTRFARFERGEGIEKKEENFAEEVAKQLKN
jgi:elongation factor Ts